MARSGESVDSPRTGERIEFRRTAADTRGEVLEVELMMSPHAKGPVLHVHPRQSERFEVVGGAARVRRGLHRHTLLAGESLVVPAGTLHRIWNDSAAETRVLIEFRPALNTETFFENAFEVLRDHGPLRGALELATLAWHYRDEMVPTPAVPVVAALAALGRALGYRPRHPVGALEPKARAHGGP